MAAPSATCTEVPNFGCSAESPGLALTATIPSAVAAAQAIHRNRVFMTYCPLSVALPIDDQSAARDDRACWLAVWHPAEFEPVIPAVCWRVSPSADLSPRVANQRKRTVRSIAAKCAQRRQRVQRPFCGPNPFDYDKPLGARSARRTWRRAGPTGKAGPGGTLPSGWPIWPVSVRR